VNPPRPLTEVKGEGGILYLGLPPEVRERVLPISVRVREWVRVRLGSVSFS